MPRIRRFGKKTYTGNQFSRKVSSNVSNNEVGLASVSTVSDGSRPSPRLVIDENPTSPKCSSSKKKLSLLSQVGETSDYFEEHMREGNVIVDLELLNEQIQNFVSCRNCFAVGSINIYEVPNQRKGIVSNLLLMCSECQSESSFMTSKRTDSRHYENNIRLVYGMRCIGKGQSAAETLCSVMNLPQPPTKFFEYNKPILASTEKVAMDSMTIARRQAVTENDGDSDITVAIDGTWQKRGHTSLHGVVSVTSLDTSKVLDVECLSKYCPICKLNKKEHPNCLVNYEGSSGGMEVAGVKRMFERSNQLPVPVRYINYLGDGDCKSYDSLCESKPYGEGVVIEKLECVNHVKKRMGTRLRRLRAEHKKTLLPDGKRLSGKGRLTDNVITQLEEYYGSAIRSNGTLEDMKKACWATFYHKISSDADPQHGLCPIGAESWCKYNRAAAHGLPCPPHENSLAQEIMEVIKPVYQSLCDPTLLKKCVHGKTQNCNEAFNNVIWSRLPKNNFVNAITLKIGVLDAVLSYNDGVLAKVKVLQDLCGKAGLNCVVGLKKIDSKRVREAERAYAEIEKRARKAKKNVKRRLEEAENEEDPQYGAGLF